MIANMDCLSIFSSYFYFNCHSEVKDLKKPKQLNLCVLMLLIWSVLCPFYKFCLFLCVYHMYFEVWIVCVFSLDEGIIVFPIVLSAECIQICSVTCH